MRARRSRGLGTGRRSTAAWLVATGRSQAIDRVGYERTLQDKTRLLETDRPVATMGHTDLDDSTILDERLELIFTCCHPALPVEAQVALGPTGSRR